MELVKYSEARSAIKDFDMLAFRCGGLIPLFARGGRQAVRDGVSHIGAAAWWDESLMCLEMRVASGGRAAQLGYLVEKYPGKIDVYSPPLSDSERKAATIIMKQKIGKPYNRRGIWLLTMQRWALWTLVSGYIGLPGPEDDMTIHDPNRPEFCSAAYSSSGRLGALWDPVPELPDDETEPLDLVRQSEIHKGYRFTLTP